MSDAPTTKLAKHVTIDLSTLPGTLSSMLVNPENMRNLADMGIAFGQFIGRDIPAHAFTAHFGGFLKAIEATQQRAEANQRAVEDALAASAQPSVTQTEGVIDASSEKGAEGGQGTKESTSDRSA